MFVCDLFNLPKAEFLNKNYISELTSGTVYFLIEIFPVFFRNLKFWNEICDFFCRNPFPPATRYKKYWRSSQSVRRLPIGISTVEAADTANCKGKEQL